MRRKYPSFSFSSFLKLVHIFSVNPHLGPLQISLGRMIIDIIKFFFIYTLVLFAFGCGEFPAIYLFSFLLSKILNTTFGKNIIVSIIVSIVFIFLKIPYIFYTYFFFQSFFFFLAKFRNESTDVVLRGSGETKVL